MSAVIMPLRARMSLFIFKCYLYDPGRSPQFASLQP